MHRTAALVASHPQAAAGGADEKDRAVRGAHDILRQETEELGRIVDEELRRGHFTSDALFEARRERAFNYWVLGQPDLAWQEYGLLTDMMRRRSARSNSQQPLWNGSSLAGSSLQIHCRIGGLGDQIQWIRFVSQVCCSTTWDPESSRLSVQARPELRDLFANSLDRDISWATRYADLSPAAYEIELFCLPFALRTPYSEITDCVPYLDPPADLKASWQQRLTGRYRRPWVGLFWSRTPFGVDPDSRDCPLSALRPLLEQRDATFISLHKENRREEIESCGFTGQILDVADESENLCDTAALLSQLDLVISVDTSISHLAGAMAKRTWLLLTHDACPRWQMGDAPDRTLWYPTTRLFRQREPGRWEGPIQEMADPLRDVIHSSAKTGENT